MILPKVEVFRVAAGFPKDRIFRAPERTPDIPGAFEAANTLLTQRANVKHWLVCGPNDNSVLGGVRALEGRGIAVENAFAIGINGTDCIIELEKAKPTSFYGSMLLSAKEHGYKTCEMLYKWIKDGVEPPLDTRTVGTLITRENFRQDFQRHIAVQPLIARAIHLAHPARTNSRENFIGP